MTGLTSGVAEVSAGEYHACALTTGGGVKCWGASGDGQLGNGITTGPDFCYGGSSCSTTPVDVIGLTSGVASVVAGRGHTCAVTTGGGAKCWGSNFWGELGNGGSVNSSTPVDVTGLTSGVAAVSAMGRHTCALTTGGGLKCWGLNFNGELGIGSNTDSSVPLEVTGLTSGVAAVDTSYDNTCAVTTTDNIKCWGYNGQGQLGNGTTNTGSTVPYDVSGKPAADTDGDTCTDPDEQQNGTGSELTGGRRDYLNPNDYFNPTHDGLNRVDDVLAVVYEYFTDVGNPGYTQDTDRTFVGPNAWNLGPPDGLQRVEDIVHAAAQYFHDCG